MMQTNLAGECVHCAKSKKQYRLASPLEAMAQREAMAQCEAMAQREAVGQTDALQQSKALKC